MPLGTNLRTFLLAQPAIAAAVSGRVHQQHVPEDPCDLYVWFARAGGEHDRTLDQQPGELAFQRDYDLECIGSDLADVEALGELIEALDATAGVFGTGHVQALFVDAAGDDYVPRGIYSDSGLFVSAYRLTFLGYSE